MSSLLASNAAVLPQYMTRLSMLDVPLMRICNSACWSESFQNTFLNLSRLSLWSVKRMSFPFFMVSLKLKFAESRRTKTTVVSAMGRIQSEIVESSGMTRKCAHCSNCSLAISGLARVLMLFFSPADTLTDASPIAAWSSDMTARI